MIVYVENAKKLFKKNKIFLFIFLFNFSIRIINKIIFNRIDYYCNLLLLFIVNIDYETFPILIYMNFNAKLFIVHI